MYLLPHLRPEEILIYLRKSRTDDASLTVEEVLSKHEQMLDEWVARALKDANGQPFTSPIPATNRLREVVSGETIKDRPMMQNLLRMIESPHYKAVLVVEPQRLSRGDLEDIGYLTKILRYTGTIVITLQYTYDITDPHDRDSFERELKRGNEFLEYQKRIMNNGRLLSVENGNFIGNCAPYGYNKVRRKEGKRYIYTLEPDPDTAPVVKSVFEMYAQGIGCSTIADKLNLMCIAPPRGTRWTRSTVNRMLINPHYIGKVIWNRRKTTLQVVEGEVVKSRPYAESFIIYEGKHDAIISQELWDTVQTIKGNIPRVPKSKTPVNPLAGLLYCSCGTPMVRRTYNAQGIERCQPRILCPEQRHCRCASCTEAELLERVAQVLRDAIYDFEMRIQRGEDTGSNDFHRNAVERLKSRLAELKNMEIEQWKEKLAGRIPQDVFDTINEQTLSELETVQASLRDLYENAPPPVSLADKLVTFKTALNTFEDPNAPVKEKNALLKQCIHRITYTRTKYSSPIRDTRWAPSSPIGLDVVLKI